MPDRLAVPGDDDVRLVDARRSARALRVDAHHHDARHLRAKGVRRLAGAEQLGQLGDVARDPSRVVAVTRANCPFHPAQATTLMASIRAASLASIVRKMLSASA